MIQILTIENNKCTAIVIAIAMAIATAAAATATAIATAAVATLYHAIERKGNTPPHYKEGQLCPITNRAGPLLHRMLLKNSRSFRGKHF